MCVLTQCESGVGANHDVERVSYFCMGELVLFLYGGVGSIAVLHSYAYLEM